MTRPRIFVHIPSYRDRECQWTIRDMFAKAAHPDRVFAGICWQTKPEEDADCFRVETRPDQVRTRHFHIDEAEGLGWARRHAVSLWQGEEYSLQIDSHMRFAPGWDETMLEMLAACGAPDPVLTVYPPGYTPPDQLDPAPQQCVQFVNRFLPNGIPEFGARRLAEDQLSDRPLPTAACAGGFIFGSSRLLRDVPFDPEIYFTGEEPSLAVRMWTHGFDLFSPHKAVIYHYYRREDGSRHWDDAKNDSARLIRRTEARMRALCEPATAPPEAVAALGPYGLGPRRSLAEYEAFSGINFAGRTLAEFARHFPFVRPAMQRDAVALDASLRPAAGLHLFLLDDEGVLFSAAKGEAFRLNTSSAIAWCGLEDGLSWQDIAADLAARRGIPAPDAQRELAEVAAHWIGLGVLERDGIAAPPMPPMYQPPKQELELAPRFAAREIFSTHHYRLLGTTLRVHYGDATLEGWVHPVLAHLAVPPPPGEGHTFVVAGILGYLFAFGGDVQLHCGTDPAELGPVVKYAIMSHAVRLHDHILHMHAGAVAHQGRLILLPAASGSGKTSLTSGLVAAGCTYFSDEVALLDRGTGRVRPAPVSLCVKQGAAKLLARLFPGLEDLPVHTRTDGIPVRYMPPPASALPDMDKTLAPALLVFPRYVPDAPTVARPLSRGAAFGRVLDECVAIPRQLTLDDASVLMEVMEGLHCYELTGSSLDDMTRTVLDLCAGLPA